MKNGRVDQYLEEFIPLAADIDFQNVRQALDGFLCVIGKFVQCPFWNVSGQKHRDNWKQRRIDFGNRDIGGICRQFALHPLLRLADFVQGSVDIPTRCEL